MNNHSRYWQHPAYRPLACAIFAFWLYLWLLASKPFKLRALPGVQSSLSPHVGQVHSVRELRSPWAFFNLWLMRSGGTHVPVNSPLGQNNTEVHASLSCSRLTSGVTLQLSTVANCSIVHYFLAFFLSLSSLFPFVKSSPKGTICTQTLAFESAFGRGKTMTAINIQSWAWKIMRHVLSWQHPFFKLF